VGFFPHLPALGSFSATRECGHQPLAALVACPRNAHAQGSAPPRDPTRACCGGGLTTSPFFSVNP